MKSTLFCVIILCAFFFLLFAVSAESAATEEAGPDPARVVLTPYQKYQTDPVYRRKIDGYLKTARFYQKSADRWYHRVGKHYRGTHRTIKIHYSLPYSKWRAYHWKKQSRKARKHYKRWIRRWNSRNKSVWKAIKAASKEYGVPASWLHNCVSTEGGHSNWVWNGGKRLSNYPLSRYPSSRNAPPGSSGALGPFQFMSGTFWYYSDDAMRGKRYPRRFRAWDSNVGQAYTAAWMFKNGLSSHWTGHGC